MDVRQVALVIVVCHNKEKEIVMHLILSPFTLKRVYFSILRLDLNCLPKSGRSVTNV